MAKVKTDELDQYHQFGVYTPARIINICDEINQETATQFIKNIKLLDHAVENKEIVVLISTEGGDVHQGLAMYDAIRECQNQVITHAIGPIWSMGSIIFQAGDKRIISRNATIMIHAGRVELPDEHPRIVKAWSQEFERVNEVCDDIILNRIREKKPNFKKNKLKDETIFDKIYTAEEALELGLVDEIVDYKSLT